MTTALVILCAIGRSSCAQSLVPPEDSAEARRQFEMALDEQPLRCQISPVNPKLSFSLRFETGYRATLPLPQFAGSGHNLTLLLRVVPENLPAVFLSSTKQVPEVSERNAELADEGRFVVGEGTYAIDLVVRDDQHRACRSSWRIQARRNGGERELVASAQAGSVNEISPAEAEAATQAHATVAKLTLLLHAAPLWPNRSKLSDEEATMLTDSISALLRQWPARSVRLIAFNLDQHAIVLREDHFAAATQLDELRSKLEHLDLAVVDYRVLHDGSSTSDLLAGLIQQESQDPKPSDAILVIGADRPRGQSQSKASNKESSSIPVFYLQYLPSSTVPAMAARRPNFDVGDAPMGPLQRGRTGPAPLPSDFHVSMGDDIQRLVSRFKGVTIPVRNPQDLAEAMHRIDPRIPRANLPPEPAPRVVHMRQEEPVSPPVQTVQPIQPVDTSDADPIEVLARLRDRVLEHGHSVPNHTCVETVERSRFTSAAQTAKSCDAILASRRGGQHLRLDVTDRLRLDVALSTDREIYSWAGANRFEDAEIDEIIPRGAMGTGPFASYLLSVFLGRPPRFVFEGETAINGRTMYEYSFNIPKDESYFRFKARNREWMIFGYSGRLFVDPQTSDLARMTVKSEELPEETDACELDTTLDYGKVALSSGTFILPSNTTQRFIGRNSDEAENVYTFSACRDFSAESSIAFGDHTHERSAGAADAAIGPAWGASLPVIIEVTDSIDSATASAGDAIHGRLAAPINDPFGAVLAPKGAAVNGRLMRVEVRHPSPQVSIALRWETIELDGKALPLTLAPNRQVKKDSTIQMGGLASLANLRNLKRRGIEFELPLPGEERYGVFHFPGTHYVVDKGLRTEWFTVKP